MSRVTSDSISPGKRISNVAEIPGRISYIASSLNNRRGTVDEYVLSVQCSLLSHFVRGVDPYLDVEIDRLKDNGLMRAMIVQTMYSHSSDSAVSPTKHETSSISCGVAIRKIFRMKK